MKPFACFFALVVFFLVGACSKEPTYVHPDAAPGDTAEKASPKPSRAPTDP